MAWNILFYINGTIPLNSKPILSHLDLLNFNSRKAIRNYSLNIPFNLLKP